MRLAPKSLCVGCGICAAACPHDAIRMRVGLDGVARPRVHRRLCTGCGVCARSCPQETEGLRVLAKAVSSSADPRRFGLERSRCWLAWDEAPARLASASGGVVTALAHALFESGRIQGAVHVKRLAAGRGGPHYRVAVSYSAEEIETGRGSAYEALDFSRALRELKPGFTYFITGTPCVIRGVRLLQSVSPKFKDIRLVTCALVCSHNVTPQLADYIADRHRVPEDADYEVDFRNKDGIANASKFKTRLGKGDASWLKMERTASGWTHVWRNYYFALDACCRCPDFWGAEADVSVKDAWGRREWTADPLGKSVVIVRNDELIPALHGAGLLHEPLPREEVAAMQPLETAFKQGAAADKFAGNAFGRANFRNGLTRKLTMARASRFLFAHFGYQATRLGLRLVRLAFDVLDKLRHVPRPARTKTILVAGGYGYGNAGDEAQCAETLRQLKTRYPEFEIVNLSPNPAYSAKTHPAFRHEPASRVAFFRQGTPANIYKVATAGQRMRFLSACALLLWNARRLRRGRPTLFLDAPRAAFLERLAGASLFFFCGGGYLTGATRSRLWDGVLICRLCRILGVPVVMSGQTIGEWSGWVDRRLARWGFKTVAVIATRDDRASLADLARIGISGERAFATHDDALFSAKSAERELAPGPYVAVNFHFWKMPEAERGPLLARLYAILVRTAERRPGCRFVFVPMVASDLKSHAAFCARYPDFALEALDAECDYRRTRRAIADAALVLTMKHHPIIFAVGEGVPVVSMAYSDYYVHKNVGALEQYGLEACSFDLSSADWKRGFEAALAKASDSAWFSAAAAKGVENVRTRESLFWRMTETALFYPCISPKENFQL